MSRIINRSGQVKKIKNLAVIRLNYIFIKNLQADVSEYPDHSACQFIRHINAMTEKIGVKMKKNSSVLFLLLFGCHMQLAAQSALAYKAFNPFDGHWKGEFRIYSFDGELQQEIKVEQHYFWDNDTQRVVIRDTYPDGRTEVSKGKNYTEGYEIVCRVEKAGGEVTIHNGKLSGNRLFWSRKLPEQGLWESFKEYVTRVDGDTVYFIDGLGIYTSKGVRSILIFEGRYRKQK